MTEKSAKKDETIGFNTPWLVARYPKISAPDLKGKFADGKYKTDSVFLVASDKDAVLAVLKDAAKQLLPGVPFENVNLPLKEFFDGKKDEQKKSAGWGLVFKSKFRPAVFDSKKNKLPESVKIGGGSVIRVASAIFSWEKPDEVVIVENGVRRKEKTVEYGLSLRLGDVQVRKLVVGSAQGDGSAFDEVEDGFEYEGGADEASSADDATAL